MSEGSGPGDGGIIFFYIEDQLGNSLFLRGLMIGLHESREPEEDPGDREERAVPRDQLRKAPPGLGS